MEPRPDYVPRIWTSWGNRWLMADPRRVLAWFVVAPVVAVLIALTLLLDGRAMGWIAAVGAVGLIGQAIVYGPRAYRAMRARRGAW